MQKPKDIMLKFYYRNMIKWKYNKNGIIWQAKNMNILIRIFGTDAFSLNFRQDNYTGEKKEKNIAIGTFAIKC